MNVFHRYTRQALRKNRSRTWVTIVGIILSVALFTAVTEGAYSGVQYLIGAAEYTVGRFHGCYQNLTEQQASNMLAGIYHKLDTVISSVGAKEFADDGEISDWAKNSVYFMEKNGIITGVGGDRLDPQADIQAQAALVMSVQMLQKLG